MTPSVVTPDLARFAHIQRSHNPALMVSLLVITDALALFLAVAFSVGVKLAFFEEATVTRYLRLWPFLLVFLVVYGLIGLYSGVALSPPEELRRSTLASTLVFVLLAATTMSFRAAHEAVTYTLLLAIVLSVGLIPIFRVILRQMFAHEEWWGYPAVIFGEPESARIVVDAIQKDPTIGLKPLVILDTEGRDGPTGGVPTIWEHDLPALLARCSRDVYAVVATPGLPQRHSLSIVERYGGLFRRVLIIPDLFASCSMAVSPKSVGGLLGLELSQAVLLPRGRMAKRTLDLVLTLAISVLCIPLLLFIACWIKLESPGPLLFGHLRIGRGGRSFRAWKFRSMAIDADRVLEKHLNESPDLRAEWELNHKLKKDPRVTRAGRFLRITSLDELPQLFNVLMGEMSLVGPRPIVESEVHRYGDSYSIYTRVPGGVTGLWQVSGRNNTSYEQRVAFDAFYVRNWSVWLDLCILCRTIGTVLFRTGAY